MADLKIDSRHTALLALDVQNWQAGAVRQAMPERADLPERLSRVAEAARKAGVAVVHVAVRLRDGYPEVSSRNRLFSVVRDNNWLKESAPEAQLHPAMAVGAGEPLVIKRRVSAFFATDLDVILRAKGIDTLVLAGISTSWVVLSTAAYAFDADYRLVFLEDCCADSEGELHRVVAEKLLPKYGAVTDAQSFIAALKA